MTTPGSNIVLTPNKVLSKNPSQVHLCGLGAAGSPFIIRWEWAALRGAGVTVPVFEQRQDMTLGDTM